MIDLTIDPDLDLVLERTVPVPPERIYACWTDADLLMPWFCPVPWKVVEAEVDPRPGGIFRTVMQGPEGERMDGGAGCFLELVPDRRIVWTDALGPGFRMRDGGFFTGIVELEPDGSGGTRYRAIARHATAEGAKQHAEMGFHGGWGAALDQLVALLEADSPPNQR